MKSSLGDLSYLLFKSNDRIRETIFETYLRESMYCASAIRSFWGLAVLVPGHPLWRSPSRLRAITELKFGIKALRLGNPIVLGARCARPGPPPLEITSLT